MRQRTLLTRRLWSFPQPGVAEKDMQFCGEGTADGDQAAEYVRYWYEANREGWFDRATRSPEVADEFILWLMAEVDRVNAERVRQTKERS